MRDRILGLLILLSGFMVGFQIGRLCGIRETAAITRTMIGSSALP